MITLALDASTYRGTVAVLQDARVVAAAAVAMRGHDAERLLPAVVDALAEAGLVARDIGRVVCGDGPGSFTSLRIAASIAKGIAVGLEVPLFRVSSLALIPAGATALPAGRCFAVLDALRGEAYFQRIRCEADGDVVLESRFYLGPVRAVADAARETGTRIVGAREVLDAVAATAGPGLPELVPLAPHALGVGRLERFLEPADLASWEPHYGRLAEAQVKWEELHGRPLPGA